MKPGATGRGRLAVRTRPRTSGVTRSVWPPACSACSGRSPPATHMASRDTSAPPDFPPARCSRTSIGSLTGPILAAGSTTGDECEIDVHNDAFYSPPDLGRRWRPPGPVRRAGLRFPKHYPSTSTPAPGRSLAGRLPHPSHTVVPPAAAGWAPRRQSHPLGAVAGLKATRQPAFSRACRRGRVMRPVPPSGRDGSARFPSVLRSGRCTPR